MGEPKIVLERVQGGAWLADCSACGVLGVWDLHGQAATARRVHICGTDNTDHVPGRIATTHLIGPPPGGQTDG